MTTAILLCAVPALLVAVWIGYEVGRVVGFSDGSDAAREEERRLRRSHLRRREHRRHQLEMAHG